MNAQATRRRRTCALRDRPSDPPGIDGEEILQRSMLGLGHARPTAPATRSLTAAFLGSGDHVYLHLEGERSVRCRPEQRGNEPELQLALEHRLQSLAIGPSRRAAGDYTIKFLNDVGI